MSKEQIDAITAFLGLIGSLCGLASVVVSVVHHRWDRRRHAELEEMARNGREPDG